MGSDCAKAFRDCPIDNLKKKMHTVQEKCLLASKYTDDICEAAMALLVKIFNTHREEKMQIFLGNLHYINDWFRDFNNAYAGGLFYPSSLVFRRKKTFASGIEMYQHHCRALLTDIRGYAKRVKVYVSACEDVVALNEFIRFSYTVIFYLRYIKRSNPAFFDKPPPHIRQRISLPD